MKRVGLLIAPPEMDAPAPAELSCPHCGKAYKTEKGLRDHCRKEHPDAFATV